jgi:UDP-3-O-[3-hydroxymyristoyl] glucosamine N-acyltransferase
MMNVTAEQIATFLGHPLHGKNIVVRKPCSLDRIVEGALVFAGKVSEGYRKKLDVETDLLALVTPDYEGLIQCPYIVVKNPRLAFARVVQRFFVARQSPGVSGTAVIGKGVSLGKDVIIGDYAVIGGDTTIGNRTEIRPHVTIGEKVKIGGDCLIKSGTVIGQEGFGFEFDDEGRPVRIPHLGSVIIGDHVEIGALNTIARGTLDDTVIGNNVKIDDHVFIAHNVEVGENTLIIACAEISGSVTIGRGVWIGPNASIRDKVTIGDKALVGLGAVVTKNVVDNAVVAGNPAKFIRNRT